MVLTVSRRVLPRVGSAADSLARAGYLELFFAVAVAGSLAPAPPSTRSPAPVGRRRWIGGSLAVSARWRGGGGFVEDSSVRARVGGGKLGRVAPESVPS